MVTLIIDSNNVGEQPNDLTIINFVFSESDHSECIKCKAGTYSKVPSDSCTPCPSDTVRCVLSSCMKLISWLSGLEQEKNVKRVALRHFSLFLKIRLIRIHLQNQNSKQHNLSWITKNDDEYIALSPLANGHRRIDFHLQV